MFIVGAKCDKSFDKHVRRPYNDDIYIYLNSDRTSFSFRVEEDVAKFDTREEAMEFLDMVREYDIWFKIEEQLERLDLNRGRFKIIDG